MTEIKDEAVVNENGLNFIEQEIKSDLEAGKTEAGSIHAFRLNPTDTCT